MILMVPPLLVVGCFLFTFGAALPADLMVKIGDKDGPDIRMLHKSIHPRTLILLGDTEWRERNVKFMAFLQRKVFTWTLVLFLLSTDSGHELAVSMLDVSRPPSLFVYGEPRYENIILVDSDFDGNGRQLCL